jgi:hypothetical protein
MFRIQSLAAGILPGLCCVCAVLVFAACKTAPADASSAEARAAADAALARMDGKESLAAVPADGRAARSAARNGPAAQTGPRPAWLDSVEAVYNRQRYLAAVGYASSREMAEKNALGNLAGIFGQSIQADQTVSTTYREAVKNGGAAQWSENTTLENIIHTSASMDTLAGAEIRSVWFDGKSVYYAAAVMEKAKASALYTGMITANQAMIANLVAMNQTEKNSLDGFSRFQFAATVADINVSYGNALKVLDAPVPAAIETGDKYRLEAAAIARSIPVGVTVKNDRAGRIRGAFAKALADLGFRNGGGDSRYMVEADLTLSEVQYPNQRNQFARYEVAANLVDRGAKTALVPYNINGREGHSTLAEAENRAVAAAEQKIGEEYKTVISAYLSRLLPKR